MNWEKLLSLEKYGDPKKRLRKEQKEIRLGFEEDYDRIIFSNSFRSLQDKTQVIPFSKTDFVHTRLTHSLEVSVVGRSLGRLAGEIILDKNPELKKLGYKFTDFGAIVASACLAHDIGNPPFGHSGEGAIGNFFKHQQGKEYKNKLTAIQYQDLCDFEGNANGFRILTKNNEGINSGGLRLSYATLGTFIKYPNGSSEENIAYEKYGYFESDKKKFQEIAQELSLEEKTDYHRHPLTFLVEAADDICYTIIDFEDGINLGWINEKEAFEILRKITKDDQRFSNDKYLSKTSLRERIAYLRALFINVLIYETITNFEFFLEEIMKGHFTKKLLYKSKYKDEIDEILKISEKKIYQSPQVLEKEIIGHKVISKLLNAFVGAVTNNLEGKTSSYDHLILRLLPTVLQEGKGSLYENLLNATCFVASLTDSKAKNLSTIL